MIPATSHPAYKKLAEGQAPPTLECLALKILLGRVKLSTSRDPSPQNVATQIAAIHEFLVAHEAMAAKDVKTIFS